MAAATAADGVQFVNKDDARGVAPRVLEQLADALRADTCIHFDELRSAGEEECHLCLTGNGPREKRFAGSRRSDKQYPLRNAPADRGEPLRFAEEINDLLD